MLSKILRLNFCYLKIVQILHSLFTSKIGHILRNKRKNKCIHEIIWLILMKMMMKMKNRSHRYDINRPRFRHKHEYSKYKKCLTMIMLICIKQQSKMYATLKAFWTFWHWAMYLYKNEMKMKLSHILYCQPDNRKNHVKQHNLYVK